MGACLFLLYSQSACQKGNECLYINRVPFLRGTNYLYGIIATGGDTTGSDVPLTVNIVASGGNAAGGEATGGSAIQGRPTTLHRSNW